MMVVLILIFSVYFSCYLSFKLALVVLLKLTKPDQEQSTFKYTPFVSVLVAARNEEQTIHSCLSALVALSYPKDRIELLVGNDGSTDQTASIIQAFMVTHPTVRLLEIANSFGQAKGKANVLAQLAKEAKGMFYFITDADCKVPNHWIQSLLANRSENTGIVSGCTKIEGDTLFQVCQQIDWLYAFGMIKVVSDRGLPVSAVGNNMMISKIAYESTGGFETIPFSITEDFQLFKETLHKGWGYKNLLSSDCLSSSLPMESLPTLIKQRKRWMTGVLQLPSLLIFCLSLNALAYPMLIVTICLFPLVGSGIWVASTLLQQYFLIRVYKRIGVTYPFVYSFIFFQLYTTFISVVLMSSLLFSRKITWKGREY